MIEFNCPKCSRSYRVSFENAGKRTKCKECGAALAIPEAEWEAVPDDEPVDVSRGRPPASPVEDADPEPSAYRIAENVSRALAAVNRYVGVLGAIACIAGAVLAFEKGAGAGVGFGFAVASGLVLVSVLLTEAVHYAILVIVDLARSARAIRQELAIRQQEG
jgi:hypothetical protein